MKLGTQFFRRHFGLKEWAALAGSLFIMILAVWLLKSSEQLEQLGYIGGFLAMMLGSATVILPAPGLAVVAALGATTANPLLLGAVAGVGATIGEVTGYLAGYGGHKIIEENKYYPVVEKLVEKRGFWAIVFFAFIPNPLFDLVGLIAGSVKYSFGLFFSATLIGKVAKCILVAYTGTITLGQIFG